MEKKLSYRYYLVRREDLYDLVRASSESDPWLVSAGEIIKPLSGSFRTAIGQAIYDEGIESSKLIPVICKHLEDDKRK